MARSSTPCIGYRPIYRSYVMNIKTVAEIADETGNKQHKISSALRHHGIELRSRGRRSQTTLKNRRVGAGR